MTLHPNSLTVPRTELAAYLGSKTLANECATALKPVRNRKRCVCFDRDEVDAWYRSAVLATRD